MQLECQLRAVVQPDVDVGAAGAVAGGPLDPHAGDVWVAMGHVGDEPFAVGMPRCFRGVYTGVGGARRMGVMSASGAADLAAFDYQGDGSAFLQAEHADQAVVAAESFGAPVVERHVKDMHAAAGGQIPADDQKVVEHRGVLSERQVWGTDTPSGGRQA